MSKRRKLTLAEELAKIVESIRRDDFTAMNREMAADLIEYLEPRQEEPIVLTPHMRSIALSIAKKHIKQNPPQPPTQLRMASFVDAMLLEDEHELWPNNGEVHSVAVARERVAEHFRKRVTAVRAAHLKYGQVKGIRGRPKKTERLA